MKTPSIIGCSFLLWNLVSAKVLAVEENAYWLPNSYKKYYLKLKEAAKQAEALERCVKVESATLDLEQSRPDHPIFRILCREADGTSYNEMVDGLSYKTLTTILPDPDELQAQIELELEQKRAIQWESCLKAVKAQADLIQNSQIITLSQPDVEPNEEGVVLYTIDFDGENMFGQSLKYQAKCSIRESETEVLSDPVVNIGPRR